MTSQNAVWHHFHYTNFTAMDVKTVAAPATINPVQHRELFARLQNMGRRVSRTESMSAALSTPRPAATTTASKWQDTAHDETISEGLGLSEL